MGAFGREKEKNDNKRQIEIIGSRQHITNYFNIDK